LVATKNKGRIRQKAWRAGEKVSKSDMKNGTSGRCTDTISQKEIPFQISKRKENNSMSVDDLVKELNNTIENNIDILWQEDWYVFYNQAFKLYEQVKGGDQAVDEAAEKMMEFLEEGGDSPSQEEWYDICDGVCGLCVELCNSGIIEYKTLEAYPGLYRLA
jgi:ferredoxin